MHKDKEKKSVVIVVGPMHNNEQEKIKYFIESIPFNQYYKIIGLIPVHWFNLRKIKYFIPVQCAPIQP